MPLSSCSFAAANEVADEETTERRAASAESAASEEPATDPPSLTEPKSPYRVRWAVLLARVFAMDVTRCAKCGGPMVLLALLTDPAAVSQILDYLGLPLVPVQARPTRLGQADLFDMENAETEGGLAAAAAPARAPPAVRWPCQPS